MILSLRQISRNSGMYSTKPLPNEKTATSERLRFWLAGLTLLPMTDKPITVEEATENYCGICGKSLITFPNNPKLDLQLLVRVFPKGVPDSPGAIVHRSCAVRG